jgi:hypothetical protein
MRFAADDSLSMPAMAARLADEHRRLHHLSVADIGLRPSLDLAYRRLSDDGRRLLRRLGAVTTPDVPRWLAEVLLGRPDAEPIVDELMDAQLVQAHRCPWTGADRLRMHDLVRLYARERCAAEETAAARDATSRAACLALLGAAQRASAGLPHARVRP